MKQSNTTGCKFNPPGSTPTTTKLRFPTANMPYVNGVRIEGIEFVRADEPYDARDVAEALFALLYSYLPGSVLDELLKTLKAHGFVTR